MKLEHVAVIGAGIMGGHLAAFFANLGISCDMYDIDRGIAEKMLQKLADPSSKIPMLYSPRFAKRVQARAISDYEKCLSKADMIVEAVPERMEIKHKTFAEVEKYRRRDAIVATNTSGLSVNAMAAKLAPETARYFVGTHYFNPIRFMELVEIIPAAATDPEIVTFLLEFYDRIGKKAIVCKDTLNFIANRVGVFSLMKCFTLIDKYHFDVETVDTITGPSIGNPNTATLRLCDMVGIETAIEVARNVYLNCPGDECRDIFKPLPWLEKMVTDKMLGEKTGKGFYQKVKGEILVLDFDKWEYRPQRKVRLDVVQVAKDYDKVADRVKAMCNGDSAIHRFTKELMMGTASYALHRLGEIADSIQTIDEAVKLGFKREIGPIEAIDAVGAVHARDWMEEFKIPVPPILNDVIATTGRFYQAREAMRFGFSPVTKNFVELPQPTKHISLSILKNQEKVVRANLSSRLIDLGDNVLLLELDHKMVPSMNPVDDFVISMMLKTPEVMKQEGFKALVISNEGANFCAGAQLQLIQELCKEKAWDKIEQIAYLFQKANMMLYHADFPVVVAPHGMTLGGGMEITLTGHKRVVYAELYAGLVEVGVGLLPGGAGNLLLLMQFQDALAALNPGPVQAMMKAFELIAYGTTSNSGYDAMDKGLIRPSDVVVFNQDELILRAKEVALSLATHHVARPQRQLYLPGPGAYWVIEDTVANMVKAGKLPPHGAVIAKKQAYVLSGGSKASPVSPITEEEFLTLEREAFVSLCGEPKSQERIAYMLKNKKPLMN